MSDLYKAIDLVGTSKQSFDDAVRTAVQRASQTVRDLQWFEVTESRGYIEGGDVASFQVKVRVWFGLEGEDPTG